MRTKILTLILLLPLSLFAFSAKVIKISDGDTITVLSGKEQTKVRLYGIDAPEKKQDYNQKT
jgi:ATP-dependent hsl protease ATP-binding subunit hslU|nr:MAG TPA: nuclease-like protein [Caudoviricetes sp.]